MLDERSGNVDDYAGVQLNFFRLGKCACCSFGPTDWLSAYPPSTLIVLSLLSDETSLHAPRKMVSSNLLLLISIRDEIVLRFEATCLVGRAGPPRGAFCPILRQVEVGAEPGGLQDQTDWRRARVAVAEHNCT